MGPAQVPRAFATLSDCALHSGGLVKVEMEKQGFRVSRLNSHSSRFYPGDIASPVQASVALPVNADGCIYLCPGLL